MTNPKFTISRDWRRCDEFAAYIRERGHTVEVMESDTWFPQTVDHALSVLWYDFISATGDKE